MHDPKDPTLQKRGPDKPKGRTGLTITGIQVFAKEPPKEEGKREDRLTMSDNNYFVRDEELGRGGMGIVYRARHVVLSREGAIVMNKKVALKEILIEDAQFGSDPDIAEARKKTLYGQLLSEVQTASNLDHDNIVKILNFGYTEDERPFYIMEYLEGVDLFSRLQAVKKMDWSDTRALMLQVCSAMIAAHEYEENGVRKPIIHRDLKPENIFLTKDGTSQFGKAKVVDFGLAKMLQPKKKEDDTVKTDGVHGTANYMAPEQAYGLEVDHRSDIYALGCIMYEMLTGDPPFKLEDIATKEPGEFDSPSDYQRYFSECFEKFVTDMVKRQPATIKSVVNEVDRIAQKCLAKKPEERYQSVRELREDIEKCNHVSKAVSPAPDDDRSPTMENLPKVIVRESMLGNASAPAPAPAPQPPREQESVIVDQGQLSPWAQHAPAEQIAPESLPSSNMPQNQRDVATMIVRNPLLDEDATQVRGKPLPQKKPRRLLYAALGIAGTLALAGGVVGVARVGRSGNATVPDPVVEPVQMTEPPVQQPDPPPAHTVTRVPDAQPVQTNVTITVTTQPRGVEVSMGGSVVCNTNSACEVTLPQGEGEVQLTFERDGFRRETRQVTPDQDRTVDVRLERLRRPGTKIPGGQQGGRPVIITTPD